MFKADMSDPLTFIITVGIFAAVWFIRPKWRDIVAAATLWIGAKAALVLITEEWAPTQVAAHFIWIALAIAAAHFLWNALPVDAFNAWSPWWPTRRRAVTDMLVASTRKAAIVQEFSGTIVGIEQNEPRHDNLCDDRWSDCTAFIVDAAVTVKIVGNDDKVYRSVTSHGRTVKVFANMVRRFDNDATCELARLDHNLNAVGCPITGTFTLTGTRDISYEYDVTHTGFGVHRYSDQHPVGKIL